MTQERSRQIGRALMALAGLQLVLFAAAAMRRSYAALALPVGAGLAAVSGLAFWVGYTMATTNWDAPADYGVESADEVPEAEGAPPPEALVS